MLNHLRVQYLKVKLADAHTGRDFILWFLDWMEIADAI